MNIPRRTLTPQKRYWKVVVDASEDRAFLGRLFRRTDLLRGGGFVPGTVFENIKTGKRLCVGHGTVENVK